MRQKKEDSEATKTKICQMHDAGVSNRDISRHPDIDVQEPYVRKVLKARLDNQPKLSQDSPAILAPAIDPSKPAPPQLEAFALAVLSKTAEVPAGEKPTVKAANAAREILKLAQKDKQPLPVSRRLKIVIDVIDVLADDKIHQTKAITYTVKP